MIKKKTLIEKSILLIILLLCVFPIIKGFATDYGLRVHNDSGDLQIDSTYVNYALWEHGENVTTADYGNFYGYNVTFSSSTEEAPLIAIKPDSSEYCGLSSYLPKSGGNYTGFSVISAENNAATFDWMAFVPRQDKSSEDYGLRVYNSSEELVFDSGHRQMIILDVDTATPAYDAVETVTHPDDSNAYFIVAPSGWYFTEALGSFPPGSLLEIYRPVLKYLSSTTVSFGGKACVGFYIPVESGNSGGYWPSSWTIITVEKAF